MWSMIVLHKAAHAVIVLYGLLLPIVTHTIEAFANEMAGKSRGKVIFHHAST